MVQESSPTLPPEVIEALRKGSKIEAIRLLRDTRDMGLKEAKEEVEAYLRNRAPDSSNASEAKFPAPSVMVAGLLTFAAFVWAFVNVIHPISSLIVLHHRDGYDAAVFTVEKVRYESDEEGIFWGFEGRIDAEPERYYAPTLADARELGYSGLQERFPVGTEFDVLHNPAVTRIKFQGRTLHVIPHTPDFVAVEVERISWWLQFCLAPLLGTILLLVLVRKMRSLV